MTAPATATLAQLRAQNQPAQHLPAVKMGFDSAAGFELLKNAARAFATSTLVPEAYRDNPANCMIALELSARIGASPMLVMQNLYVVHGQPGWSAKFLIACVNTCGRFTTLRYEWRGKPGELQYGCRAWAVEHATGERLDGTWVDWEMVTAEKWDSKTGSKWKTMRDQMFIYRSSSFWQRAYAPEISMGMSTVEDLADVVDVHADGSYTVTTEQMRRDMKSARVPAPQEPIEPPAAGPQSPDQRPEQGPALTYAEVRQALEQALAAGSLEELDAASALTSRVASAQQRAELVKLYGELRKQLVASTGQERPE